MERERPVIRAPEFFRFSFVCGRKQGRIAAAIRGRAQADFRGLTLGKTIIGRLDMGHCKLSGLRISGSLIQEVVMPTAQPDNTTFEGCQIGKVFGITDRSAIPGWLKASETGEMESAANVNRIKSIHLEPQIRVLVTILKKIFLQKGTGRQEDALMRGLGRIDRHGASTEILKILKRGGLIKVVPGDHRNIYIPERRFTDRVRKMAAELATSKDTIWTEVAGLSRR